MTLKTKLDNAIGDLALLNSRFYQAWNEGELPRAALAQYASEYGRFIQMLPAGWETLSDVETAEEEHEHAELWDRFAAALDTRVSNQDSTQVAGLIGTAERLFSKSNTALGAMYAFEVQQPETSVSKLEGLRQFYPVPAEAEEYFQVHSANHHESEKLLARMSSLSETDQAEAVDACREMSLALWNALDAIYEANC